MRNLERLTVETGRVIQRRYLLQRLIQQGQTSAVYQGFDQVLQRTVAVKAAAVEHISIYRAAIRATAQFTHPNIIGIYDLILEPDALYIVQEYVDGDDFGTLLQSQLSPYYVVDLGVQICQALMYAATPSRKICHGDLTPAAIVRDRRGFVRVNNFALPGDVHYFSTWNILGGGPTPFSDPDLPVGQASEGRYADDTRAVGLLLYQLLTSGRSADARTVEPPTDGRLRFMRNTPPEVCEVVARTVIRQHPQNISAAEALHAELKKLADALAPAIPVPAMAQPAPALAYQVAEEPAGRAAQAQFMPVRTGLLSQPLGASPDSTSLSGAGNDFPTRVDANERMVRPEPTTGASFDMSMSSQLAAARQAAYNEGTPAKRVNMPLIIILGLFLFALFFGIGYYLSTLLIH
ncbi:protein kinase domain-containing protein [Dictyobacter arantiisoli]|uniref:non-specific serine/threonine protein kinase n=1 Tax=Dictyobacter arantiisoli TaxID=2014874 RepID=A0A5A5T656_9CHLR|nr:protein kinase [Dictyobacter arantiisoli]GCF06715.1 hypothetical protein KDI_02790 [Dictyobacter arantiisoli]